MGAKFILAVYLAMLHPSRSLVVFSGLLSTKRALLPPAPSMQAKLNAAQALGDCSVPVSADACSCGEYSCTVVLGPTNARKDEPALISFLEFIH